ncbi:MAG: hypothetical protein EU532_13635 [Promethearchaeota archaeon]|nr:MAG: hypothetical protein EU532_13635 [Candidatus Lokiarchaeota archaeon]
MKVSYILKSDFVQEIVYAGLGCILIIMVFNIIPEQFHFSADSIKSIYPRIMIIMLILIFLFLFLILNQQNLRRKILKIDYKKNIILFSIFNFTIFYFLFFGTDYSFFGLEIDNWWRAYMVAQMAEEGYPCDFAYKNLPSYYYPFYFYSLALIALLFNIEPYKMLRYGFLFCYYILPIIVYEVWNKIYEKKVSFIISVFSAIFFYTITEVNQMICYLLIVPYFIYYYENYPVKKFGKKDYFIAGILGSILFCTYLTYFFFIPIYYFIQLLQNKHKFKEKIAHILKISILIILFSSWYLVPLFISFLIYGFENHVNNVFNHIYIEIPFFTQIYPFSLLGIIVFIGFIYLIKNYSFFQDFKILGNMLLSLYILILIGFFGYAFKTPLFLNWRLYKIPKYILIICSSIYIVKFFDFLSNNKINFKKSYKLSRYSNQLKMYLIITIFCVQTYNIAMLTISFVPYEDAFTEEIPKDRLAVFGEIDYKNKVFLTGYIEICPYIPIKLFLLHDPQLSHPSALHNERVAFLEKLAKSKTPKIFYDRIVNSKFEVIDYFYLKPINNNTEFEFYATYCEFRNNERIQIVFSRLLFEDKNKFEEIIIDDEIVYRTIY